MQAVPSEQDAGQEPQAPQGHKDPGDSLKKRFIVKLGSNIASIPLYLAMEAILPRALGPEGYGNFSFVTAFFQQVTGFLDMGSSTCFYTVQSRRQDDFGLVAFYSRICLLILLLCLLLALAILYLPGAGAMLMPGVPAYLALWGAFLAFLYWYFRVARGMTDALGLTTSSELIRTVLNLVAMALLVGLYCAGLLDMTLLFCHQYTLYILSCLGFFWCLRRAWPGFSFRLSKEQSRAYGKEFSAYCFPLFTLALFSVLFLAGERWLLQYFDGSTAQGFFSLSQKIGMACFMFTIAMTPLIMREFSLAHAQKDVKRMAALFDKHGPMLYTVAAYFSCFAVVEAEAVVRILGGEKFAEAVLPVQIMAFYPMHQSYGQVTASIFYATGDTKALRNNSAAALFVGIIAAWFMLAPASMLGLNLGAVGLAIKTVGVQFLFVNILLMLARKVMPLNFWGNLAHQLFCPLVFIAGALLGGLIAQALGLAGFPRLFAVAASYSLFCALSILAVPWLAGLARADVRYIGMKLLAAVPGFSAKKL